MWYILAAIWIIFLVNDAINGKANTGSYYYHGTMGMLALILGQIDRVLKELKGE